jgi:hypothetical protein
MAKKVVSQNFSAALDGARTAKVDINVGSGNLTVGTLQDGGSELASGTLHYMENQDPPTQSVNTINGQATLKLSAIDAKQPWIHFPWAACNGATEWQINLNPKVRSDILVYSGGGNIMLHLARMAVTSVSADTGGGNMEVVLPVNAKDLRVNAKSGAGNVTVEVGSGTKGSNTIHAECGAGNVVVSLPGSLAAHISATSGLGKAIIDPRFRKINENTYQSPNYDKAADKVEILIKSGAGNVSVN